MSGTVNQGTTVLKLNIEGFPVVRTTRNGENVFSKETIQSIPEGNYDCSFISEKWIQGKCSGKQNNNFQLDIIKTNLKLTLTEKDKI